MAAENIRSTQSSVLYFRPQSYEAWSHRLCISAHSPEAEGAVAQGLFQWAALEQFFKEQGQAHNFILPSNHRMGPVSSTNPTLLCGSSLA